MEGPQQAAHAAGTTAQTVSASVARMQAKAAQLAEELHMAQVQASNPHSGVAIGSLERSHTVCAEAYTEAGSPKQSIAVLAAPSVFRRLSAASTAVGKPAAPGPPDPAYQAVALQCQKLDAEVQLWKVRHAEALKEMDRHQDSYMRREELLKAQLAALTQPQDETAESTGASAGGSSTATQSSSGVCNEPSSAADGTVAFSSGAAAQRGQKLQQPLTLQDMQQQVLEGLDELLQRQRLQMRTEESQQLRQFRGRLAEIEAQLAAYRQAAATHQDDWMGKTVSNWVALREELTVTQEIAGKLDTMYKLADEEAAQLRVQFRAQEDDRQHLIRQILALKRENMQLKEEQSALQDELDQIMTLALAAEAEEPSSSHHLGTTWSTAVPGAVAAASTGSSTLAAAAAEKASRRGTGGSGSSRPQSASSSDRQHAACRLPRQQQQHCARPWSAAPHAQHTHGTGLVTHAPTATSSTEIDAAAVEARMIRYGRVIQKLQKLLEVERRHLRQVRNNYNAELSKRTELQTLLLESMELAKQQHRDAGAACQAQQSRQALVLATGQQTLFAQMPRNAFSSTGVLSRPASAAFGGRQAPGGSRPASAVPAAGRLESGCTAPGASHAQQLDANTWDSLLADLLARRQVLELLFKHACPDFVAEANELFVGCSEAPTPVHEQLQHPSQLLKQFIRGQAVQQQQQQHQLSRQQVDPPQQQQLQRQREEDTGSALCSNSANNSSQGGVAPYQDSEASTSDDELLEVERQSDSQGQRSVDFGPLDAHTSRVRQNKAADESRAVMQPQRVQLLQEGLDRLSNDCQQQQQQQPAAGLSGVMLPGFPVRQPLYHTRAQRSGPRRQQQQQPQEVSNAWNNRPSSVIALAATGLIRTVTGRPQSAVCSLQRDFGAARAKSSSRPASRQQHTCNSRRPATAAAAMQGQVMASRAQRGSSPQWTIAADQMMESFLSSN